MHSHSLVCFLDRPRDDSHPASGLTLSKREVASHDGCGSGPGDGHAKREPGDGVADGDEGAAAGLADAAAQDAGRGDVGEGDEHEHEGCEGLHCGVFVIVLVVGLKCWSGVL